MSLKTAVAEKLLRAAIETTFSMKGAEAVREVVARVLGPPPPLLLSKTRWSDVSDEEPD
jgi:hypothetical protein